MLQYLDNIDTKFVRFLNSLGTIMCSKISKLLDKKGLVRILYLISYLILIGIFLTFSILVRTYRVLFAFRLLRLCKLELVTKRMTGLSGEEAKNRINKVNLWAVVKDDIYGKLSPITDEKASA